MISFQIESESNPFFSFLPHRYGIGSYRLAGFDLEKILPPGANVLYLSSTIKSEGYGTTIYLLRFQIYWAIRSFIAYIGELLDYLIPPLIKDFARAYIKCVYDMRRKISEDTGYKYKAGYWGLIYWVISSLISVYCSTKHKRALFFQGMSLEDAYEVVEQLRRTGEELPEHIATIVSYNASAPVVLPRTPVTTTSISGEIIEPSKKTIERYKKIMAEQEKSEGDHESRELERIIEQTVKFIWWCYILGIKYVTVHESLGTLILHRTRVATRIHERMHLSEAASRNMRICCPTTHSAILIEPNSESWETCDMEFVANVNNGDCIVFLSKVGSGYEPSIRKIMDFVEPFDCMTQSVQAINADELASGLSRVVMREDKSKIIALDVSSLDAQRPQNLVRDVLQQSSRLSMLPQLLVLFGAQNMSEGFPLWHLLVDCILWQTPFSVDSNDKDAQLNQLMCAIREYADFRKHLRDYADADVDVDDNGVGK